MALDEKRGGERRPMAGSPVVRRSGGAMSVLGLLLVCVCFFLPFSRGCKEDVIPADESFEMVARLAPSFLLAYALVPPLLLYGCLRSRRIRRTIVKGVLILSLAFLVLFSLSYPMIVLGFDRYPDGSPLQTACLLGHGVLLAGLTLVVLRVKLWRLRSGIAWCGLISCLPSYAYFAYWDWRASGALYGMHLTVLGFAVASSGFLMQMLHHRSVRRWVRRRRLRSLQRAPIVVHVPHPAP